MHQSQQSPLTENSLLRPQKGLKTPGPLETGHRLADQPWHLGLNLQHALIILTTEHNNVSDLPQQRSSVWQQCTVMHTSLCDVLSSHSSLVQILSC